MLTPPNGRHGGQDVDRAYRARDGKLGSAGPQIGIAFHVAVARESAHARGGCHSCMRPKQPDDTCLSTEGLVKGILIYASVTIDLS